MKNFVLACGSRDDTAACPETLRSGLLGQKAASLVTRIKHIDHGRNENPVFGLNAEGISGAVYTQNVFKTYVEKTFEMQISAFIITASC